MCVLSRGDVINDTYEVLSKLGAGNFGEVYRVKHRYLGDQVLKVLDEDYVERSAIETVMAEAKNLNQVLHRNVVRFYDMGSFKKDGREYFYLTMEYVPGETLSQLWDRKSPFSVEEAMRLMKDILAGLEAVHTKEILHRDINGDNILLDYNSGGEEPVAKVADFGLSYMADPLSGAGMAAGRYLFWAPECFHGAYVKHSDVFSAGMVFYRMVTGVFPWRDKETSARYDSAEELETEILKARKEDTRPPSYWNDRCPEELDDLILKSLAKELTERFNDAGSFREGLVAHLPGSNGQEL